MSKVTDFDYSYFDDPHAFGYRGYQRPDLDDPVMSIWCSIADICHRSHVQTAIDVGCAKGFLVDFLISQGIDAMGYDVSTYALSFSSSLPCYQHDIRSGLPCKSDAVITLGVLMYLHHEELPFVLSQIRQATKMIFLFSAHYRENRLRVRDPLRIVTQPRSWWIETIESAGFQLQDENGFFDVYT